MYLILILIIITIIIYKNSKSNDRMSDNKVPIRKHKSDSRARNKTYVKNKKQNVKRQDDIKLHKQKQINQKLNNSEAKGEHGENLILNNLNKIIIYNKTMMNIYLPKKDGRTTEIDLLMITHTGIYVFESKYFNGWIFGSENQSKWVQSFPNNKKFRFYNPLWQNRGHIKALKNVLNNHNDELYKSYIVFGGDSELKSVPADTYNEIIIKDNLLLSRLNKDIKQSPILLNSQEISSIYKTLEKYTNVSEQVKQQHVRNLQGLKGKKNNKQTIGFKL